MPFQRTAVLCLVLLFSFSTDFRHLKTLPVEARFIVTDHLRHLYVVTRQNEIIKYNPDGEEVVRYSNKRKGKLAAVDCTNPMRLLLFYPEYAHIIVLDNFFSNERILQLNDAGIDRVGAVGLANDNRIWVYDELDFKLKKLDLSLNVIATSNELNVMVHPDLNPNFLRTKGNLIYLNDPERGIIVFDQYANYSKTLPIKGLNSFQVINDDILFFANGKLKKWDSRNIQEGAINYPMTGAQRVKDVKIQKDRLYRLGEKQVDLFAF